ncbi:MAG: prolipoprotein diacylglyceryl transferase [Actinomycetota bacterium]|jgi:phosphatidylglycerol:prolipoprotein diacylglycerol transferase|nr:prolipoprotein diacylglyceryl transferase [Actinomycetota bacterium]
MKPVLLAIGTLELRAYSTMIVVAAVAGVTVAYLVARRRGMPARGVLAFFVGSALAVPVGARLLHIVLNPSIYSDDPARAVSSQATGFALYGGLLLAALVGWLIARRMRLDLWRLADAGVPGIATGLVLVRFGCFLNGCCFGHPTDSPLGVTFPSGSLPHLWEMGQGLVGIFGAPIPLHPAQLYEATGAVLALIVAAALCHRGARDGVSFLVFVAMFSSVRWANWDLFRGHPTSFSAPDWFYPVVYGALILVCGVLVVVRSRGSR